MSTDSFVYILEISWDMHVHFIRTFKEFSTFYCGYVSMTTLEIKKNFKIYIVVFYSQYLDYYYNLVDLTKDTF